MREQLKLKYAEPEQADEIGRWLLATKGNMFDPAILTYPSLRVLCSYNGSGPCAYLPMQTALMLESVALKPGLDSQLAAQAFRDLVKGATFVGSQLKINELYFLSTHDELKRMAENHGFEEIEWAAMRMKL